MNKTQMPKQITTQSFSGYDNIKFVENRGLIYPLTPCCDASATGTEWGTACRSCYEEIDSSFGICWTPDEFKEEFGICQ